MIIVNLNVHEAATPWEKSVIPPHALPPVIEGIRQAHITSAQANAVVHLQAALFAGLQGQLRSSIPSDHTTPSMLKALNIFSYGGIVLNVGASLSAMFLIDLLGHLPEQYWRLGQQRHGQPVAELQGNQSDFELLEHHGSSSRVRKTYAHCQISLILAWVKLGSDVVFAFTVIIFDVFWGIVKGCLEVES
ncbi:hypothetical protein L208DRAFT_1375582 [Tricholoma matsutake]|nr:hypothetical protein L208DRAFT_1375582 [Tricholoma matsutake 945]